MFDPSRILTIGMLPGLFGFHVNIDRGLMSPALDVARIFPTTPDMVWAGDPGVPYRAESYDTVFLLFVDEAEALALLAEHRA